MDSIQLSHDDMISPIDQEIAFQRRLCSCPGDPLLAGILSDLELGIVSPAGTMRRLASSGYFEDPGRLKDFVSRGIEALA